MKNFDMGDIIEYPFIIYYLNFIQIEDIPIDIHANRMKNG